VLVGDDCAAILRQSLRQMRSKIFLSAAGSD
jgi:hypothetical protein